MKHSNDRSINFPIPTYNTLKKLKKTTIHGGKLE